MSKPTPFVKSAPAPKGPRVGGEIDAFCTKCRMDLNHRIVAMVGSDVKRVVCLTCNGEHNYRRPAAEKAREDARREARASSPLGAKRATAAAKASATKAERSPRAQWERAIAGQPPTAFRAYSIQATFSPGDLVRHPKFGDGVIGAVVDARKVEVLFEDGPRTMAQGM